MIEEVTPEVFIKAFSATKVKHWYKGAYISYYKRMVAIGPESIRQWLCLVDGVPVAGLAVHDYLNSSVHLVAFTGREAYRVQ